MAYLAGLMNSQKTQVTLLVLSLFIRACARTSEPYTVYHTQPTRNNEDDIIQLIDNYSKKYAFTYSKKHIFASKCNWMTAP